jgi:transcription elongation factor GreA
MQIPYRKSGKYSNLIPDPLITKQKYEELEAKLEKLKLKQPYAAAEVSRLAELGDFSENAEYQLAKGKLRGINNAILRLDNQLHQAEIIAPQTKSDIVRLGSTVTVSKNGIEKKYQILGSAETKPHQGIISYHSPIGEALMGSSVGDIVTVKIGAENVVYTIIVIK